MAITAALVKELRDRTGAGMMDCKKALVETNADLEAAIDLMRASGAAKAAKKAGRVASEGLVNVTISDDNKQAAILEVNSETDFVTKGSAFIDFVEALGALALKNKPESVENFLAQKLDSGETVDEARENIIAKIGENISVRRVQIISTDTGILGAYKHGDRIAVLTVLASQDSALAKDVAMHIAASRPECVSEDQLSEELLEREKAIFIEQARESGKPDNIIEKMIVGRMKKFVNEVTLYGQSFVKDPDMTVGDLVKSKDSEVQSFIRYEVGEGIEKKEDNFVEEVMAQAQA
jgi:elongation factor Ts|tara:strand:+ start:122 stop:1000 length:879 start_codon:yes stop_codon:yes gene_type:complete